MNWFSGSRLNLKEPVKRVGSYGMTVTLFLSSMSGTLEMSTPSINMVPEKSSIILLRASPTVVFPAPVLPTIPTFSPDFTSKERFLRAKSVYGLYFK